MHKIKFLIIVFLQFLFLQSGFSQVITVNFTGEYLSSPVDLDRVIAENLNTGESVILETDFILDLVSVMGVENIKADNGNITPNPFNESTLIEFPNNVEENVQISVIDISGRTVFRKALFFQNSVNSIKFTAGKSGVYFVNIVSNNSIHSQKVVCNLTNSSEFNIQQNQVLSTSLSEKTFLNTQLQFTAGDLIKYTAFYDNHVRVLTDYPTENRDYDIIFHSCIDFNDNIYPVTKVGNQWWMAQNLMSDNYSDGSSITGDFSYGDNSTNNQTYGKLYTWAAVMNGSVGNNDLPSPVHGICPQGWHVPSEAEWDQLRDFLGGWESMGAKLKETGLTHWVAPNSDATNESGMSLVPSGMRWDDGEFQYLGEKALFWTATDDLFGTDVDNASGYTFFSETPTASYYLYTWDSKLLGKAVRCVLD